MKGNINADNAVNVADLVLLNKYLLSVPGTELKSWQAGDMNGDGKLNTFDLILMRQNLIKG